MSRIIPCRIPGYDAMNGDGKPRYYVTIPDVWLGEHMNIKEQAIRSGSDEKLLGTQLTFAVSLALADDYRLPGLESKEWDFNKLPGIIIAWTNAAVYGNYEKETIVSKNFLEPLPIG